MAIKIIECLSVSPATGTEQSLPLVYFDMMWFGFRPTENLNFYPLKCSESYFMDTIIVQLKHSLSLSLKHFLPLAGKIVFPLTSTAMPVSGYTAGDSIPLTVALSDADFTDMTGNHSRAAHEFHCLVPQLPPAIDSDEKIMFSPIAFQVTLFPNQGISVGFTVNHAVCDGRSIFAFIDMWASVNKLNSDRHLAGNALPSHDRSRVQHSAQLDPICWAEAKMSRPTVHFSKNLPPQLVRATFILNDAQIEQLKKIAMMKKPAMGPVSSFVVVCAHVWSCLVKLGEEVADDELRYLSSPVDCRARLEPPLPENYFGNCVAFLVAYNSHGKLRGNEGFCNAAEAIAAAISETPIYGGGVAELFMNLPKILAEFTTKRLCSFIGSVRMDPYCADYGWGRPIKYECIHNDYERSVYFCKGRNGGVEIGMSMPKANMDAFAAMFNKELHINSNL